MKFQSVLILSTIKLSILLLFHLSHTATKAQMAPKKSSNKENTKTKVNQINFQSSVRDVEHYSIPELNFILAPFSNCLIHLINFRYINIPWLDFPVVLERYQHARSYLNDQVNVRDKLNRPQRDNFKWRCVFHGFLHQILPKGDDIFPEYYLWYWTLGGKYFTNSKKHRQFDYYFLFLNKNSKLKWQEWLKKLETNQKSWGPSNNAIVYYDRNNGSFEIKLACHFCKTLDFEMFPISSDFNQIPSQFMRLRSIITPERPFIVSYSNYQAPTIRAQRCKSPKFSKVNENDISDFLFFQIIYPNKTYRLDQNTANERIGQNWAYDPQPRPIWINVRVRNSSLFPTSESSYKYLTCDGRAFPNTPSFYMFISAYKPGTWTLVFLAVILIAITLKLIFLLGNIKQNALLLPLVLLVEQSIDVSSASKKMVSTCLVIGTWLLMGVIITNAYKGQNITDLTSPISPKLVETFDELVDRNFTIISKVNLVYHMHFKNYSEHSNSNSVFFYFLYSWNLTLGEFPELRELDSVISEKINSITRQLFVLRGKHNKTILESILDCNKTALAALADDVDVYEKQLRRLRPKHAIAKSNEALWPLKEGWTIERNGDPLFDWKLEVLLHSGIAYMWKNYIAFLKSIRSFKSGKYYENEEENQSLGLKSNITVLFYLYVVLILICVIVEIIEIIAYPKGKVRQILQGFKTKWYQPY